MNDLFKHPRCIAHRVRYLVGIAGLTVAAASSAAPLNSGALNYFTTPSGVQVWTGPGAVLTAPARVITAPGAGSALVTVSGGVRGIFSGSTLTVAAARTVTAANVARGVAAAARIATPWGAAFTLATLLDTYRCAQNPAGVLCDAGIPATPGGSVSGFSIECGLSACSFQGTSKAALCSQVNGRMATIGYTAVFNGTYCQTFAPGGALDSNIGYSSVMVPGAPACAGGIPAGYDGKCAGGTITQPTEQSLADRIAPGLTDGVIPGAVGDSLDRGATFEGTGITVSGPASLTGPATTTTTTGPSGTVTTTKTPVANVTYAGDTINYNITNTTTVNNGGAITTTVENPPLEEPKDPCLSNPSRVGCMDIGSSPTDPVPTKEVAMTYAEEVVDLPSGCPEPYPLGNGTSYSFTSWCTTATTVKPVMLACVALGVALMCLAVIRGQS